MPSMLILPFIIYSINHILSLRNRLMSYHSLFLCRAVGRYRKVDGNVSIFIHKA